MFVNKISRGTTLAFAITSSILLGGQTGQAASLTSYIGTVFPTAATYCPQKTAEANGQLLDINSFQALYSVVGTAYGGDGYTNFGLPDLRGRVVVGAGTGPGLSPTPRGLKNGQQFVTLTTNNLPAHTHTSNFDEPITGAFRVSTAPGTKQTPDNYDWIASKGIGTFLQQSYIPAADKGTTVRVSGGTDQSTFGTVTVQSTGSGAQMGINTPTIVIRYCVVTEGLYPPHS